MRRVLTCLLLSCLLLPLTAWSGSVDINQASAQELAQSLKGIGTSKAQAIVAYREAHGRFEQLEDLAKVKGIGAALIERNRNAIRVDVSPKR